jgi:hypothetical protein
MDPVPHVGTPAGPRRAIPILCVAFLGAAHVLLSAWWMHENGFFSTRPPYQDARLARNFGGRWFSVAAAATMMSAPVLLVNARVFYGRYNLYVLP